jgi:hypothetical protein
MRLLVWLSENDYVRIGVAVFLQTSLHLNKDINEKSKSAEIKIWSRSTRMQKIMKIGRLVLSESEFEKI